METRTEKYASSVNNLLETSVGKIGKLLGDLFEERVENAEDTSDLLEVHDICYNLARKVTGWYERVYPTTLPWLPQNSDLLKDMTLLSCNSPWSFVLTYPIPDPNPMKNIKEESLIKFTGTPKIGCFVGVVYRSKLFRGFLVEILSYNRLKVVNIDTSEIFILPRASLFYMPPVVCGIHALSMNCCMIEEDDVVEKVWSEELGAIFSRALQECSIKVENVKTVCQSPPKYMVELISTNRDGHSLNLTNWLHNTLIPDIKKSLPQVTANEELFNFLKDESIDPFSAAVGAPIRKDVSLVLNVSKENILSSLCSVPPSVEGLASSSSLIAQTAIQLRHSVKKSDNSKDNCLPSLPIFGKCPLYSMNKQCGDVCLKNRDFTDVSVECEDFSTHGDLHPQMLNRIKLPGIGEQARVVITNVLSALNFYVAMEGKYSDYVVEGWTESYDTLINRLNDPFNAFKYPSLPKPPSVGQMVVFRAKASGMWVRGVVAEVGCNSVNVVDPDVGLIEMVFTNELKTITDEDMILPFQAVLTNLHNIRFTECTIIDKAKDYFYQLILSKQLYVVVKSVDIYNFALEVELFTTDQVSINEALLAAGFCVKVTSSPPTTE